jgi:hypothetical protein
MMCLGWSAEPTCNAADQIQIAGCPAVPLTASPGVAAGVAASSATGASGVCRDIRWFWLSAAGILLAVMLKGRKKK